MTLSCGHEQGVRVCKDCLEKARLDENAGRNLMNSNAPDASFLYPPSHARMVIASMGEALKANVAASEMQMDNVRLSMAAEVCEAQGFREVAASLRKLARQ